MIDVVICSASRLDCFKKSFNSLSKLKYSGELRFLLHEDIHSEKSLDLVEWAYQTKKFDKIVVENPHGQYMYVRAVGTMLRLVKADYMFLWCDDFILEREIDLDLMVKLFEKHKKINQIAFNKRPTLKRKPKRKPAKQKRFSKVYLTTNQRWSSIASFWRMSYIRPYWHFTDKSMWWSQAWKIMHSKGYKDKGCFYFGKIGEKRFFEHIGKGDKSLRCKIAEKR